MKNTLKYVGLDVSKKNISVAIADEGREAPRFLGTIVHTPEAVRKLIKKLGDPKSLVFCYEAGPTGYELYRWLLNMGVSCTVIAPSLTPTRPGDHIKTDRRDALRLSQLFRAGELTSIHVPTRDDEALRDLVRARANAKEDQHRARQRVSHFLLRHQIVMPETIKLKWTQKHQTWLTKLKFDRVPQEIAFREHLHAVYECEQRLKRLEDAILEETLNGSHANIIQAVQSLRGIAHLTAITLVAEIGSFSRFRSPAQLMAYLGLVPRESSSGETVRRGKMTKSGNSHVRRALIESAWSYRYKPAIKRDIEKRLEGQSASVQSISWKAQNRLHERYRHLMKKGKISTVVIGAIARELVGFIWSIACEAERQQTTVATEAIAEGA